MLKLFYYLELTDLNILSRTIEKKYNYVYYLQLTVYPKELLILYFSILLSILGILSLVFIKKTLIHLVISIELIYLGLLTQLIIIGNILNYIEAYVFALILLSLVAVESIVLLSLIINMYKSNKIIDISDYYCTSYSLTTKN